MFIYFGRCWVFVAAFLQLWPGGLLFVGARGLLTVAASLVSELRLQGVGFSSCNVWAQ